MKTFRRHFNLIATIILIVATIIALYSGAGFAFAAKSNYSDVLDDLREDSTFNAAAYPAVNDDYSMQIIQVAEGVDGELFVYVYQPAARIKLLIATTLNMSLEQTANGTKSYRLTLLSSTSVFQKYRVEGIAVSSKPTRYYNISNMLRPFDSTIDEPPAVGQSVSAVPNKVAQLWTAHTENGETSYSMLTSEVIEITTKHVGYCIYDDGLQFGWGVSEGITKAYFVAFDTDKPIDKLISADLTFFATRIQCKACGNSLHKNHKLLYDFHDEEYIDFGTGVHNNTPLTITYTQKFSNQGGGNWRPANKYTFNRIRTTEEFIADSNNEDYQLTSTGEQDISDTKWVLNFYEAQDKVKNGNFWLSFIPGVSLLPGVSDYDCELNNVFDVEILRLEFETDGKTYNLGVVDNKQTGDNNTPGNEPKIEELPFWQYVWRCIVKLFKGTATLAEKVVAIIALAIVIIFFPLVITLLCVFFPAVGKGILWIFKAVIWLISAPFKFIAWLFRKHKKDGSI